MKDLKHYVYVYCNPLKPGKYEYFENGIGISFDFEPFYIGEGKKDRIFKHLKNAKKDNNQDSNRYKINTIKQILDNNLNPIIYKIFEFENEQDALNFERTLGFLIGRKDQKRGPLTNLVDCGLQKSNPSDEIKKNLSDKKLNMTDEQKEIRVSRYLNTLKENPEIKIQRTQNRLETEKNNPEIQVQRTASYKKTLKENPEININKGKKISKNWKNKSEEEKQIKSNNYKETLKNNPSIVICRGLNIKKSHSLRTIEEKDKTSTKMSQNHFETKRNAGRNNAKYIILDHQFLIIEYFKDINLTKIIKQYNLYHNTSYSITKFKNFFLSLKFPIKQCDGAGKKKFIEENKHKIQWYIDNYERLEEEYMNEQFYIRWRNKFKDN